MPSDPQQSSGTVARTVRMVAALADLESEAGVNQIADRLGLAPSTAHRLLKILCDEGIASWNPAKRGYAAGPSLYRIAARAVASMPLGSIVRPAVERLAQQFNETVLFALYLPAEGSMAFLVRADGSQALQYRIEMNTPLPLLWGASGKAILAVLPDDEIARVHTRHGAASPASAEPLPDLADLMTEMVAIRSSGTAVTDSEKLPGARGIAAPVFSSHGVIGCLVLTSPRDRLPHSGVDEVVSTILATADELSTTLGAAALERPAR